MDYKKINTVFFDAADTLFYIRKGLGNTYAAVARKHGADPNPDSIRKAFSSAFRDAPPLAFENVTRDERSVLEKRYWRDIVEKVYEEIGMFEGFDAHFEELFEVFRTEAWVLFPESARVLSSLKEMGYRLGIISNFDSRVYDVMSSLGIYDYFDVLIISSEAGYAKPDLEIYLHALEKAGADPSQTIHVGDHAVNDFHGPRALGIKTLLLDREGEHRSLNGAHRIDNLNQLEKILANL